MSEKQELVDITDFTYDFNQPQKERLTQFLRFIKNPYKYKHGKHTVIIEFGGAGNFDDCFVQGLKNSGENF